MRPMLWVWAGMLNDHHMGWGRGFKDGRHTSDTEFDKKEYTS